MADPLTLDGFDLKILAVLQDDARLGNQEIAERVASRRANARVAASASKRRG